MKGNEHETKPFRRRGMGWRRLFATRLSMYMLLRQVGGEGKTMFLSPRHADIVAMAKENGRVTVEDLAGHFGVSPQTIRKDLNDLCNQRHLTRIHGGALFPSGIENVEYEARRKIAADEKSAIGKAAALIIPDGASLFINIGTTTEAVGEALLDHDGLMVITNNINVANRLRVYPSIEVVIAGGGRARHGWRHRGRGGGRFHPAVQGGFCGDRRIGHRR